MPMPCRVALGQHYMHSCTQQSCLSFSSFSSYRPHSYKHSLLPIGRLLL